MQFIPYKIDYNSFNVDFFVGQNNLLKILSTEEDTIDFLKEQAIEYIKYKEGGEKALNCICTLETVGEKPIGYLVLENPDKTFTLIQKISGFAYGYSINTICYYKFKSFSKKTNKYVAPSAYSQSNMNYIPVNNDESNSPFGSVLNELIEFHKTKKLRNVIKPEKSIVIDDSDIDRINALELSDEKIKKFNK